MIKKQTVIIIVCALAAAALLALYLLVLSPWLESLSAKVSEPPVLLEGERLGMNNAILMFDQVDRENLKELTVRNAFGEYSLYYSEEHKDFFIKDNDAAPYQKEALSSLIVAAGYPAVSRRVFDSCPDFTEYGLRDEDAPGSYTLKTRDGKSYTVYFGRAVPTGAGCYARYEGRDALYIVDSSSCASLLAPVEDMISPILAYPASQSDYHTVKDFLISRDGEKYVEITTNTNTVKDANGEDFEDYAGYEMKYPAPYNVSVSVYDTVLQTFMSFYGEKVYELGKEGEVFSPETLEKYGLRAPKYEVYYVYNGLQNSIFFSKKQEDGTYFAYSLLFNTICSVKAETVNFLEYDLIQFIDKPLIQINIDDMARIKVDSPSVRADFRINGSGTNIVVTDSLSGRQISSSDFRQFYMTFLTLQMVTYADVTDQSGLECIGTFAIETDDGRTATYSFYPYATRRTLFTVDGDGEFYCLRTTVATLIAYTADLLAGRPVVYAH